MNLNSIKLALARWVKGALPATITNNAGTYTAGTIKFTVSGTEVTQAFTTSKDNTLRLLAAKIASTVPEVSSCVYDAASHIISVISTCAATITIVPDLTGITGTMTFGAPEYISFMWENQSAPRPALPYVSGKLGTFSSIGQDYNSSPVSDIVTITGNRETVLMLQAFGSTSVQLLSDLRASLEKPTVQAYLRSGGLAFVEDNGGVNDISQLLDSQDEQRASLDLRFRTSEQIQDKAGTINTVVLEETFKDLDGTTITLDTITIQ